MFKFAVVIFAVIACAAAKPGFIGAPLAYTASAPLIAAPAPFVTATSSQVIARNYNGITHAPIVATAPVAPLTAVATPLTVAPAAYNAPLVARYATAAAPLAYSSPLTARYAPYVAAPYAAPFAANYIASPYAAAYSSPLRYAAAAPAFF